MPDFKVRRKILAMGGIDTNTATGSLNAVDIGGTSNYAQISSTGRLTMAGTGRVRKTIWIDPEDFMTAGGACSGSWTTGSMNANITGSVFAGVSSSMVSIKYIGPAAKVSSSPTTAFAKFAVPTDADTTGSLTVVVDWTCNEATDDAGSVTVIKGGIAYFGSGSTVRTAASAGASPVYAATAGGTWMSTSMGNFPSFGSNDTFCVLVLQHDLSETDETLGGSTFRVGGVRVTYTANALGDASAE